MGEVMELQSCGDLQSSHGNIEGVILGDSLACMIEELEGKIEKTLLCDNTAAAPIRVERKLLPILARKFLDQSGSAS